MTPDEPVDAVQGDAKLPGNSNATTPGLDVPLDAQSDIAPSGMQHNGANSDIGLEVALALALGQEKNR